LRSLSGRPCRKIDVHACVSVSQFQNRVPGPSFGATVFVSAMVNISDVAIYDLAIGRCIGKSSIAKSSILG
jgi:hypothetical protein